MSEISEHARKAAVRCFEHRDVYALEDFEALIELSNHEATLQKDERFSKAMKLLKSVADGLTHSDDCASYGEQLGLHPDCDCALADLLRDIAELETKEKA